MSVVHYSFKMYRKIAIIWYKSQVNNRREYFWEGSFTSRSEIFDGA